MSPTAAPDSRVAAILPWRLIGRNTGPSVMPLFSSQSWNERTGHVAGFDPYGTPIFLPSPSWSVFERRIVTTSPSLVISTHHGPVQLTRSAGNLQRTRSKAGHGHAHQATLPAIGRSCVSDRLPAQASWLPVRFPMCAGFQPSPDEPSPPWLEIPSRPFGALAKLRRCAW